MSDVPNRSQQMLSSWVKRPIVVEPSNKAKSQKQWSDIFKKPSITESHAKDSGDKLTPDSSLDDSMSPENISKNSTFMGTSASDNTVDSSASKPNESVLPNEPKLDPTSQDSNPKIHKPKRHINPYNPFSSFVVTMKTPKGLHFPLPSQSSSQTSNSQASNSQTDVEAPLNSQKSDIQLKPKDSAAASFFTKRPTAVKSTGPKRSFVSKPFKPVQASYKLMHVRPERSWSPCSVTKRTRHAKAHVPDIDLWDKLTLSRQSMKSIQALPHLTPKIHKPTRRLLEGSQLEAIAMRSQSPGYISQTSKLCVQAGEPNAFDLGLFEGKMWSNKYAPRKPVHHMSPQSAEIICAWLKTQQTRLEKSSMENKPKRTKRKTMLGGFIVEDRDVESDDEDASAILLVSGPSGSGKTSAVHAAAESQGFFVFEINASVKRTGKELSSMLDGISRNHAVHSAKKVVILVDDADIVYENEAGSFWPTIMKFASISRRPVVITCTDRSLIALPSTTPYESVTMNPANWETIVDLVWIISLKEGHLLDKSRLSELVTVFKGDLRKILATLQFWCQYGIGGQPSGADWAPKASESIKTSYSADLITSDTESETEEGSVKRPRVISDGTWFEIPNENWRQSDLIDEPEEFHVRAEDSIWANGAIPISRWVSPVRTPPHRANAKFLRSAVDPYDFYSVPTQFEAFALDTAPYMRHMVVSDLQRELARTSAMSNLSDREQRMMTRSMREAGVDTRNCLGLTTKYMTSVLQTGFRNLNQR